MWPDEESCPGACPSATRFSRDRFQTLSAHSFSNRLHRRWCDTFNLKMMGRRRKSPVESPDAICRNRWLDVWDISAWIGEF